MDKDKSIKDFTTIELLKELIARENVSYSHITNQNAVVRYYDPKYEIVSVLVYIEKGEHNDE